MKPVVIASMAAVAFWTSTRSPTQGQHPPPSLFLSATSADVLSFARAVAAHRLAGGVLISAATLRAPHRDLTRLDDPRDRDLPAVQQRFNATHPDHEIDSTAGTFLIRNRAVPPLINKLLGQGIGAFDTTPLPAVAALQRVGDSLALDKSPGGGYLGSGGGPECPVRASIARRPGVTSTRELLDQISIQSGLIWMLVFDLDSPINRLQLGYLCPDGSHYRFTVRGW